MDSDTGRWRGRLGPWGRRRCSRMQAPCSGTEEIVIEPFINESMAMGEPTESDRLVAGNGAIAAI